MKNFFKIVGYVLLGILVLLIALGIIMPKDIDTTVVKEMDVPQNFVYNVLSNPSINSWDGFMQEDPNVKITNNDKMGVGAGYAWESQVLNDGQIVIDSLTKDKRVKYKVFIGDDDEAIIEDYQLQALDSGTATEVSVDWSTHLSFPKNIMAPFITHKVSSRLTDGLDNLDALLNKRKNGEYMGFKVNLVDVPETYYVTNRSKVNMENYQQWYSQNLSGLFRTLSESMLEAVGPDCALVYDHNPQTNDLDVAAALPVSEEVSIPNTISVTLPRSNALVVDYYGNRAHSDPAHYAMDAYMTDRNIIANMPVVEEYVTDVLEEKDPEKWLTKIIYRIAE